MFVGPPALPGLSSLDLGVPLVSAAIAAAGLAALWWQRRPIAPGLPVFPRDAAPALPEPHGLHAAMDVARVGLWQLDEAGRTVFANAHLLRLFGGALPAGLDASGLRLAGPADPVGPLGFPAESEAEALLIRPGQPGLRLLVTASQWFPAPGGRNCVLSLLDITALRTAQARIEHLAEHDALTGLPNRAAFRAALEALACGLRGGIVAIVDLDGMRDVNERLGHAAGDALLREAGQRLRHALRASDMVCRLGEDEFAVLAFEAEASAAEALMERLAQALASPFAMEGQRLSVSAAIGAACAPAHGTEAATLLRAAETALSEAKRRGRNGVCVFDPDLLHRVEARARLRLALADALQADELALHIQPQVESDTGRLAGAEALLRWRSARLGRDIPPLEILDAAAEAGLLPALDRWVLRRAASLLAQWDGLPGAPPRLGINVSAASLHDPGFAAEVSAALAEAAVPPERLEIEIPEDLAVRDLPGVARTFAALREAGVLLSLDDFGSGHTNLPHLLNLPVHCLKLDRSIVQGLEGDARADAVLRATMLLARAMGIEVVGEGVETEAQAAALRRAGCRVVQGWLTGRPVPAEDFVSGQAARLRAAG
jgi:diguanylate cyclase (GGDEF)-like protein